MTENGLANLAEPTVAVFNLHVSQHLSQRRIPSLSAGLFVVTVETINQNQLLRRLWHKLKQIRVEVLGEVALETDIVIAVIDDYLLGADRLN